MLIEMLKKDEIINKKFIIEETSYFIIFLYKKNNKYLLYLIYLFFLIYKIF